MEVLPDFRCMQLKVVARIKPSNDRSNPNGLFQAQNKALFLRDQKRGFNEEYAFDGILDSTTSQERTFSEVGKPLVGHVMSGFNACCCAYGQTGSGKTYSILGKEAAEWDLRGLIPRCCEMLFTATKISHDRGQGRYVMFVSFLEVYLDQIRDLGRAAQSLLPKSEYVKRSLELVDDSNGTTQVKDLACIEVRDVDDVMNVLKAGLAQRHTLGAALQQTMPRTHTLFTISIMHQPADGSPPTTARLNLVDLASSEKPGGNSPDSQITKSTFTALCKVVRSLSDPRETAPVPFTDSKLTRILKDGLLGNTLMVMMAQLNPNPECLTECVATLQYALRCSVNSGSPSVSNMNADPSTDITVKLTQQVQQLSDELNYTHAHYQKLLERVGGPDWARDMGPMERAEDDEGDIPKEKSLEHFSPNASSSQGQERRSAAMRSSRRSSGSLSVGGPLTKMQAMVLESRIKSLEAALDQSRAQMRDSEEKANVARIEADTLRDRSTSRDHAQFNEIRKLRLQITELTAKMEEERDSYLMQITQLNRQHEDDVARVMRDADGMRFQLQEVMGSVNGLVEDKSTSATSTMRRLEALRDEEQRRRNSALAKAAVEREQAVENIKQQSTYFLQRKTNEAVALADELSALKESSSAQVSSLQRECETLFEYAEKMTEVLQRLQNGAYPVSEKNGLKSVRIPMRDKPVLQDAEKLAFLKSRVDFADRLQTMIGSSRRPSPPKNGKNGTVPHEESPKAQWEDELRASVTAAALADLRSHKTVEYIRTLESQVNTYRLELQNEKRRTLDAVVATRSVTRVTNQGATNLTRNITSPLMRSPTWGPGHAAYDAAALLRPNTANSSFINSIPRTTYNGGWGSRASSSVPRERPQTGLQALIGS